MRWHGRSSGDRAAGVRRPLRPRAAKELAKLARPVARRILTAVERLGVEPRPHGARPLVGYPGLWRIRIGDYRVVYTVEDKELVVLALRVAHRSDVYRNL